MASSFRGRTTRVKNTSVWLGLKPIFKFAGEWATMFKWDDVNRKLTNFYKYIYFLM